MALINSLGSEDLTIDPTESAARMSVFPAVTSDLTVGGYRVSMKTGTLTAGLSANSSLAYGLFYGRSGTDHTNKGGYAIITSIDVGINIISGYTAGSLVLSLYLVKPYYWVTKDNSNVTDMVFSNTYDQSLRTYATTASNFNFGVATTTGMTGGSTAGLETVPISSLTFPIPSSITGIQTQNFLTSNFQSYPLILQQQEGFKIINDTAFPATGTSNLVVSMEWLETEYF